MAKLHDGALALVHKPKAVIGNTDSPLRLSLSTDNGQTWPRSVDLESDGGCSPAIIPTCTGMAITYTRKRKQILFWHGSVERAV